jgi:LemA protein
MEVWIGIVVVGVVVLLGLAWWVMSIYNNLVNLDTLKMESWSGVDVQLKRRHDLVGNLVNTVKSYMTHERGVLEEVTKLRAMGESAAISGAGGMPSLAGVAAAEGMLTQSLGRLFARMENYPDLKANTNVMKLQEDLAMLEDQIQMARRYYNGTVRNLNILVRSFPSNIIAKWFSFALGEFFELGNESERAAPVVDM